eukprot:g4310.t1
MKRSALTVCVYFFSIFIIFVNAKKCHELNGLHEGDSCHQHWGKLKYRLHPTQLGIGKAWALKKYQTYMSNKEDAQNELDEKPVPVVLGPNSDAWLLDHHHLLAALDYSMFNDLSVTINIVCVFDPNETMDQFWKKMQAIKGVYAYGRPVGFPNVLPILEAYNRLPTDIAFNQTYSSFNDNMWRALAGFSRKVNDPSCNVKYCGRAFIKECASDGDSIPFYEFRWSYFFNLAYINDPSKYWDNETDANKFNALFKELETDAAENNYYDIEKWELAAKYIVPLARGKAAGVFTFPNGAPKELDGKLPGYHSGMSPIEEKDPSCNAPKCPIG